MQTNIPMPKDLEEVVTSLPHAYLVGGCVRDHFLGLIPKDFDTEVYQMSYQDLSNHLANFGKVDLVGKSFGVLKLTLPSKETHDFSIPRRDSKTHEGHTGFTVEMDPNISPKEAASRRDLTINALAWNPKTTEILDHFGGVNDLQDKLLRHTSEAFKEDPLRILRVFQFSARFGFEVAPETASICQGMIGGVQLSKERMFVEFEKFLLKGKDHLLGFKTLNKMGALSLFPELEVLHELPQDIEFHPEGDVLTHTALCLTALSQIPAWQKLSYEDQLTTMFGVLCHDLGKATTTSVKFKPKLGRDAIVSPGHDKAGVEPAIKLLNRLKAPNYLLKKVPPLVAHHMDHLVITNDEHVRRLAVLMGSSSIAELAFITEADHSGRHPLPKKQPEQMVKIIEKAAEFGCLEAKQTPIVMGRDIIATSTLQGKAVGAICNAAYEAQIQGKFQDQESAKVWVKENRAKILENAKLAPPRIFKGNQLVELGFPADRNLGKLLNSLLDKQIDGNIESVEEAIKFMEENKVTFSISEENLNALKSAYQEVSLN